MDTYIITKIFIPTSALENAFTHAFWECVLRDSKGSDNATFMGEFTCDMSQQHFYAQTYAVHDSNAGSLPNVEGLELDAASSVLGQIQDYFDGRASHLKAVIRRVKTKAFYDIL